MSYSEKELDKMKNEWRKRPTDYQAQAKAIVSDVLPLVEQILIKHWEAALEEIHAAIKKSHDYS